MNWITGVETAIEYIENNLNNKLDYEKIAAQAYCSSYHFQRMFSVLAGCTLGEYIRARRMTLAGAELKGSDIKILDLAFKYCYESSESFSRAFAKFHGITPSQARKENIGLKSFSRLSNYELIDGGNILDYRIIELQEQEYFVSGQRYDGTPYSGKQLYRQDSPLSSSTSSLNELSYIRSKNDKLLDWYIIDNVDDNGYDFYYAYPIKSSITKIQDIANIKTVGFPKAFYAVFKTEKTDGSDNDYMNIFRQIFCEWLPSTNYRLLSTPELIIYRWNDDRKENGYIEIYIPVALEK